MPRGENLDLLLTAYEDLVKAGNNSLSKAYVFGQVVRALHRFYSYREMGAAINRSESTVSNYAKLAGRYPTEKSLLDAADELGTYDVARLSSDNVHAAAPYHMVWHCSHCGGTEFTKSREPVEEPVTAGT
jgi:hypothetical protein